MKLDCGKICIFIKMVVYMICVANITERLSHVFVDVPGESGVPSSASLHGSHRARTQILLSPDAMGICPTAKAKPQETKTATATARKGHNTKLPQKHPGR